MEKKPMLYTQRTIDFDVPPKVEAKHIAELTSEPPPAHQARLPPPLMRPDRQLTYDGAHSWEWPDATPLHDQDTITVDRIHIDIDGPSHRFIINRFDHVEVFFSAQRTEVGEVIGISHAKQEVCVRFPGGNGGVWFFKGQIYPTIEPKTERSKHHQPLSTIIAAVNDKHRTGLTEDDRVPPTPPPVLAPYTFDDFKKFHRQFPTGSVPFESHREQFERLLASRNSITSELKARFKAKELVVLASRMGSGHARRSTKDENAVSIVTNMLRSFVLDSSVSYSPFQGETYVDAIIKKVRAVPAGEYARAFEKRQAASMEHDKALENPETFFEFRTFINAQGEDALSDEQLARYDTLHADITRERRAQEAPNTVTKFQSDDLQRIEFQMKEGFHDKRQRPLWIVQLSTRVERDAFNELNRKAKMLSGWYSSFKKADAGFQFLEKDQADRFCALLNNDADRTDVLEARKERKELTAAERLHELADELLKRADETIERSNGSLQNTARRADIQAGVRGRAFADQAISRTLHSIAEALSRGEARYLDGIRHKTHVETLDMLLRVAQFARLRKAPHSGDAGRQPDSLDIRYADYPFPTLYRRHLENAVAKCQAARGAKQAAERMSKRLKRDGAEYVTFHGEQDIEALEDFVGRLKKLNYDTEIFTWALEKYQRLHRAGITDIHELRSALREYLSHRAESRGDDPVRIAERELIGKELPGFFPTPRPVIKRMLELAEVEGRHKILEPSCGKGDILDALKEECPGIELVAIERNCTLSDVLSAKGHEVQFGDFLEHQGTYDRILQNPPFEHGQDVEHIRHAYSLLSPGGRLVSVVSEGPFFRVDNKSVAFRDWLEEVNADVEQLPEDAFQGLQAFRQTGVRTRLISVAK